MSKKLQYSEGEEIQRETDFQIMFALNRIQALAPHGFSFGLTPKGLFVLIKTPSKTDLRKFTIITPTLQIAITYAEGFVHGMSKPSDEGEGDDKEPNVVPKKEREPYKPMYH